MEQGSSATTKIVKKLSKYACDLEKTFKERGSRPDLGITSLPVLNNRMWGWKRGELVVVGGRPSNGKSVFVLHAALDAAYAGKTVVFLSLEMDVESILERLFCNRMKVDNQELLVGKYVITTSIQEKWKQFKEELEKLKLLVTCGIGKNFREVLNLVNLLEPTPDIVIVDYIQAIRANTSSIEQISEYIRQFREYAVQKKFCGILVSQINRTSALTESKEPDMSQLKSTGTLEEHSDKVILCHWPYHYNADNDKNQYKITISKNRNGLTGKSTICYEPQHYKFSEFAVPPIAQKVFKYAQVKT